MNDRALALPEFRLFLAARSISWAGNAITLVALPILVFQLTGSPALTGLLTAVEALPYLVFGLPAGALADRWNRKRVLVTAWAASGIVMATIPAAASIGLLTIPLMTSVAEDALRAVPNDLRDASYGLGAKKVSTVCRVIVPAAVSGLVAGLILSISRAIGETMVVFLAAGGTGARPDGPLSAGITITSGMVSVATGTDNVAGASNTFQSAFFLGLILFVMTLLLNVLADRFVRRVRQKS